MHIETLATCHNRREQTLKCFESFKDIVLPEGFTISHNIVDDGSTDGTFEALNQLPFKVDILRGNGNLFWAGGMRAGWKELVKHKKFDYLLVYNDDVEFFSDALHNLFLICGDERVLSLSVPHVLVGSCIDQSGSHTTYGGRVKRSKFHPLFTKLVEPGARHQEVDTLNMNCAAIHVSALNKVGFLSPCFIHSQADFEFGLKVKAAGGRVLLAPNYIGLCELNVRAKGTVPPSMSLCERFKKLTSEKEQPLRQTKYLYKKHGGRLWFLFVAIPYVKVFALWLRDRLLFK